MALAILFGGGVVADAQAADISRLCEVDQIGVMSNRIHIKCAPVEGKAFTRDIQYYAMSLSQPEAKINAIITLAATAKQIRKPLVVWFNWDDYKSVPGCLGQDCRVLIAAALE